ncbi:DUF4197 domain-containing protein [Geothermobacter hydrogeniphilus]|uniref:DUF4197 domain-containing protein n=1 Tax=Geothermobacter hydrogeniphilus TaxID=1969733 RepID=A0A1X0Y3V2_9BACT|nr:DUF4197 domain-containing protein [Geothermobacter hydrogeniphilus]ORJ59823.1 hypothetical protein B5V00_09110 [Geothermobacter hydrogeniphilus]
MPTTNMLPGLLLAVSIIFTPGNLPAGWWEEGQKLLENATAPQGKPALSEAEIGSGLKEALRIGSERVVEQLGRADGFNGDEAIHIPLPPELEKVDSALTVIGMGRMTEDLELQLNRAAEAATPKAKALFSQAIREMTIDDVMAIYNGPEDAATRYFKGKMSAPLAEEMRPVVADSLTEVGAIRSYDSTLGEYRNLPFVPDIHADLTGWVVEKGLDGIFYYLAKEEAAIRADPARRTTELLQKVFGGGN